MLLAQSEFESLLLNLRANQTESPTVEGKADLLFDTEGDRAYFIRHAAALANNVEPSYLIIGVENRTWAPIGLDEHSPLRDADATQQRLHQILANRLDPNLGVRYRVYMVEGIEYGLVAIEGTRAPYIVAIEDQLYGGDRSRAAPAYIYRGAIYIRHGANSVIANRQSAVLEIVNRTQPPPAVDMVPDQFLEECNYLDVDAPEFGRHPLSSCLVAVQGPNNYSLATSWVTFLFYPPDGNCTLDTVALKAKLRPDQRIGRGPQWYEQIPRQISATLSGSMRATARELLSTFPLSSADERILQFIRIRPTGHIEIGCSYPLFVSGTPEYLRFVATIGHLWQLTYFSRAIYRDAGHYGKINVLLNVIGARDIILAGLANGWSSPLEVQNWVGTGEHRRCEEPSIQCAGSLPLVDSSDDEIEAMICQIARDLGSYFGHDHPRCFDRTTEAFPSDDYLKSYR